MAHFAKIESGIVTQVIVAEQEYIDTIEGTWVQTSYTGSIRKNYAGVGYTYDSIKDIFISPQPFPSWSLDKNGDWQAPIPYPEVDEGSSTYYRWNEENSNWEIT